MPCASFSKLDGPGGTVKASAKNSSKLNKVLHSEVNLLIQHIIEQDQDGQNNIKINMYLYVHNWSWKISFWGRTEIWIQVLIHSDFSRQQKDMNNLMHAYMYLGKYVYVCKICISELDV